MLLALDAGGTHTRCALLAEDGRVLGEGLGGPANWSTLGAKAVCRSVGEAVEAARRAAGLGSAGVAEIAGACIGLAGYYPPWHAAAATAALEPLLGTRPRLEPDLKIAWAGATGLAPGVVVVAGTGSVAYGERPATNDERRTTNDEQGSRGGRSYRAGGWGPLAGDEGSAPWIGAAALRAVGRALDGRGPMDFGLRIADCARCASDVRFAGGSGSDHQHSAIHTPQSEMEAWLRSVYRDGWGRSELAALAPKVAAAAAAGDAVAVEIMTQAAAALSELALAVLRGLEMLDRPARVSLTGGVAAAGEPLVAPFRRWLALNAPAAEVVPPLLPPLGGAALLAIADHEAAKRGDTRTSSSRKRARFSRDAKRRERAEARNVPRTAFALSRLSHFRDEDVCLSPFASRASLLAAIGNLQSAFSPE